MRASGEQLAAGQRGVRASDAERDQAIGELRDRYAEGRLSQDTFLYRIDAALRAKDRAELHDLFADLPGPHGTGSDSGAPRRADWRALGRLARSRLTPSRLTPSRAGGLGVSGWRKPPPLRLPPESGKQIYIIGRELACDLTLTDLSVSRWHARLHREDETWILADLGSTNGTRLNGWRVSSGVRVRPGDRVTFGSITFVLTDRPAGPG
jgi:hypothetical protein